MRKMRVALKLSPLTTALFANSPFVEGKPFGGKSYAREGVARHRPGSLGPRPDASGRRARRSSTTSSGRSTCPMFMFKRDGQKFANTGQSFRSFWKSGFQGHKPNDERLEDAPQHAVPRGPPQEDDRGARRRLAGREARVRAARALDRASSTTSRRSPRPTRSRADWTYDEVNAHAQGGLEQGPRRAVPRRHAPADRREGPRRSPTAGSSAARSSSPSGKDERAHLARLEELVAKGEMPCGSPARRHRARARHARRDHRALRPRHRLS